jgi:hypothetical protein
MDATSLYLNIFGGVVPGRGVWWRCWRVGAIAAVNGAGVHGPGARGMVADCATSSNHTPTIYNQINQNNLPGAMPESNTPISPVW